MDRRISEPMTATCRWTLIDAYRRLLEAMTPPTRVSTKSLGWSLLRTM